MARTPESEAMAGVGKSGSPAPRSMTSSPAALRRFASCEMAIVAEVSRWCRLGERPAPELMAVTIASLGKGTQPLPSLLPRYTILPTSRPLTIEDRVTVAEARAALARGRPVVLVRPPAVRRAQDLWEILTVSLTSEQRPGGGAVPTALIVCADDDSAADWAAAAPADVRVHAVTGLARTSRVLKERPIQLLAGAVKDLAALVERSALKLDAITSVVVAWPESLVAGDAAA